MTKNSNPSSRIVMNNDNNNNNNNSRGKKRTRQDLGKANNNRLVTFTKRRLALFKKASQLCTLTGAEIGIILKYSAKRFYAFGHPNVYDVTDHYLNDSSSSSSAPPINRNPTSTITAAEIREYNMEFDRLSKELKAEKKKLKRLEIAKYVVWYWEGFKLEELDMEQLQQYASSLKELKEYALTKAAEFEAVRKGNTIINPPTN
ncbi:OLC1v1020573C1 [Oldenlandia corymbosa var. corymbosa]|uniref:OLC1v1020573C1 n=1 Tax=Oldenlandia corymbosa var. corymbosa TaxID=529605 RepID=A0AAV1EGW8_OLDCO|nr:OLC1v1020573C1 [Oldenlandia corymbosa var. corymbosa]